MARTYAHPVSQLLSLGEDKHAFEGRTGTGWPDYTAIGLAAEHVPDLIRMATDGSLLAGDDDASWGPIHAWRALGQLNAAPAIVPLLDLLNRLDRTGHELGLEEVPVVLSRLGPESIGPAAAFMRDARNREDARGAVPELLERIAGSHPQTRDRIVAILSDQLRLARYNPGALNDLLVSALVELSAVEAEPVIRAAYEMGGVDEQFAGTLERAIGELRMDSQERAAVRKAVAETWDRKLREQEERAEDDQSATESPEVAAPQTQDRFGFAWYEDEATWRRVKETAADSEALDDTFEQWRASAREAIASLRASGYAPTQVAVDPDALLSWCRAKGRKPDGAARAQYVADLVAARAHISTRVGEAPAIGDQIRTGSTTWGGPFSA